MKFDAAPAPQADALDSAVFQRVWSRVTAGQEHSPIAPAPQQQPAAPAPEPEETLILWMDRLAGAIRDDQLLARRWPGPTARAACANAARLREQLRGLETAFFLLTGQRRRPLPPDRALPTAPRDQALRLRWLRLADWCGQLSAVQGGAPEDALYQELARQLAAAGDELRLLLQRLWPM